MNLNPQTANTLAGTDAASVNTAITGLIGTDTGSPPGAGDRQMEQGNYDDIKSAIGGGIPNSGMSTDKAGISAMGTDGSDMTANTANLLGTTSNMADRAEQQT